MPSLAKWMGDAMERVMGSKMPVLTVVDSAYLNTCIKKVRFQGNLSGMDFRLGHAVIIRVNETEFRNYTAAYSDIEKGILEIVFYVHGNGPGSAFADLLKIGDQVRVSAPRGHKFYFPNAEKHLVFGDETTLGLAVSFQSAMKYNQHQFAFYFELDEENQNIPALIGLENYTVFSKNNTFRQQEWVNGLPVFLSTAWLDANFVLTGNAASVKCFRSRLKEGEFRGRILSQGYWLEGKKGL